MSCHLKLLIVYPQIHLVPISNADDGKALLQETSGYKEDPDGFVIWSADDQIDLGNINRTPREPRSVALTYIGRCCYHNQGLVVEAEKSRCIAPPFLLSMLGEKDQAVIAVKSTGTNQAIHCFETNKDLALSCPTLWSRPMRTHNQMRMRPDLDTFITSDKYHRAMGPLVTWHACTDIARWIGEERSLHEPKLIENLKQPMAEAVLEGWRQFLMSVGSAGAKALIIPGNTFGY